MGTGNSEDQRYWMQQAARLSRRINLAWFLQGFAGPLLITAVIGSVLVLGLRREFPDIHPAVLGGSLAAVFVILALIVLGKAWKCFESPEQSLVRIESSQCMNSALSAASAGIVPWPEMPNNLSESLTWHLPKTLAPPAAALILLAIGLLIPISASSRDGSLTSREPQAWSQLDSQIEKLTADATVDESYLEDVKERLEQLRAQEEEQWFSHASLEATDSLKESHNSNMQDLQQDLSEAADALQKLTEAAKELDAQQKQKLAEQFEDALQGLKNGAMKPNEKLLDQLSQIDPNNLGKLTPEQLNQLKENMEKLKESLNEAGQGEGQGDDWADQLLGDGGEGQDGEGQCPGDCDGGGDCEGECQGDRKNGPGKGGINRGPGHDPNVLKNPNDTLDVGEMTALEAKDLSRATPGDLLQLQDGKHTADQSASQSSAGGQAVKGAGGDRVWRESLAPDEQRALKNFFE
jgi:hypothetical protein